MRYVNYSLLVIFKKSFLKTRKLSYLTKILFLALRQFEPVFSRDQIVRREQGQGNAHFPCLADHKSVRQPYPVDPHSTIRHDHNILQIIYYEVHTNSGCGKREAHKKLIDDYDGGT